MSRVRAACRLPDLLGLDDGVYGALTVSREIVPRRGGGPGLAVTRVQVEFDTDVVDPEERAQTIALVVENITSDHQTFQAALIGTAISGDQ